MILTREQAIEEHRKMWNWLAKTGAKYKSDYFDEIGIKLEDRPDCNCYCCEYSRNTRYGQLSCRLCPIDWDGEFDGMGKCINRNTRDDLIGLYYRWESAESKKLRKRLAKIIANLPERKEER